MLVFLRRFFSYLLSNPNVIIRVIELYNWVALAALVIPMLSFLVCVVVYDVMNFIVTGYMLPHCTRAVMKAEPQVWLPMTFSRQQQLLLLLRHQKLQIAKLAAFLYSISGPGSWRHLTYIVNFQKTVSNYETLNNINNELKMYLYKIYLFYLI